MAQRLMTDGSTDCDEPVWCENVWCGLEYVVVDGWGGLCPSCVTLVDEHLGSGHHTDVVPCVECRRSAARRRRRRSA